MAPNFCMPTLYPQSTHIVQPATQQRSTSDISTESQSSLSPLVTDPQTEVKSFTQQQPYLRFECGCEQCSVYDYISGKICPNPRELPFPRFEVSEIPPEEIDYIEQEFSHQTRSIHTEFCCLMSDTFEELEKNVEHLKLISHLKILLTPKWNLQCKLSGSTVVDKFENVNASDLREYLINKNYCSWFDYELLEHLRKRYIFPSLTDEDKALSGYKEHFKCYVSRRCFIYLHDTGPWPKNQVEVKCKLDVQYGELSHALIKHLKYVFAKIIGAPAYHLAFKTAKEGCTELIFRAPEYFTEITKLSAYQISQLTNHGFIELIISGRILLRSKAHGSILSGTLRSITPGSKLSGI